MNDREMLEKVREIVLRVQFSSFSSDYMLAIVQIDAVLRGELVPDGIGSHAVLKGPPIPAELEQAFYDDELNKPGS